MAKPDNPVVAADRQRRRDATESSICWLLASLGLDELRVIENVAVRLVAGRSEYGELDLEHDERDFGAEAAEEETDLIAYLAMRDIARQDRRLGQLHCEATSAVNGTCHHRVRREIYYYDAGRVSFECADCGARDLEQAPPRLVADSGADGDVLTVGRVASTDAPSAPVTVEPNE